MKEKHEEKNEVKPSFTWEFIGLQAIVVFLTFGVTTAGTLFINHKSRNYIEVSTSVSQNLADINPFTSPASDQNRSAIYPPPPPTPPLPTAYDVGRSHPAFQVLLNVGNNKTHQIYNLYRYDITIRNSSESAIDDFQLIISVPDDITLVQTPIFVTTPSGVAQTISTSNPASDIRSRSYRIGLLNPGGLIKISAFGYSEVSYASGGPLGISINKKDWFQKDINQPVIEQNRQQDNSPDIFHKNISDWTSIDYMYLGVVCSILLYLVNSIVSHLGSLYYIWKNVRDKRLAQKLTPSPIIEQQADQRQG